LTAVACSVCGQEAIAAKTEHTYTDENDTTCDNAGCEYTREIGGGTGGGEAHEHTPEVIPAVEATCTKTGLTEGSKCSACGEILIAQEEIPMLEHDWDEGKETREPTCTKEGEKTYTCKSEGCGETKTEPIAKVEHAYTESVIKQPTCTTKGIKLYTCSVCGTTKTESIAKIDHTYSEGYTDNGNGTHSRVCVCGASLTAKHTFDENSCTACGAKPETIFDLGGVGQKTEYVGNEAQSKPDNSNGFDSLAYTSIASATVTEVADKTDHFYWDAAVKAESAQLHAAYTDESLHFAFEIVRPQNATGKMTFVIKTAQGTVEFTSENGDVKAIVTATVGEKETVVYTLDVNRSALFGASPAAMVLLSTGDDEQLNVGATYTDDSENTLNLGTQASETVTNEESGETLITKDENAGLNIMLTAANDEGEVVDEPKYNAQITSTTEGQNSVEIDVFGIYNVGGAAAEVVCVDINWADDVVFEYVVGKQWDDKNHTVIDTTGSWSVTPMMIEVVNHSNQKIGAALSFEAVDVAEDGIEGIEGKFIAESTTDMDAVTAAEAVNSVEIISAATNNAAEAETVYFYITGGTLDSTVTNATLGTITVTITAKGN